MSCRNSLLFTKHCQVITLLTNLVTTSLIIYLQIVLMVRNVANWIMLLVCLAFFLSNCEAFKPAVAINKSPKKINKNSHLRQQVSAQAHRYIGARYKYAGYSPRGFDCSGFTSYVFEQQGISLSRSSSAQAAQGRKIPVQAAQPGDLIFFSKTGKGKVSHVALVVANDRNGIQVVHSTSSRGVISENITQSRYWRPKILFARDVISL